MLIQWMGYLVFGYLFGSVMFGYLIPKVVRGIDVKSLSSDGNPGTANAFFYGGAFCGILVLLGDLLKGMLPVYLASRASGDREYRIFSGYGSTGAGTCLPFKGRKKERRKGNRSLFWSNVRAVSHVHKLVAAGVLVCIIYCSYYYRTTLSQDSSYLYLLVCKWNLYASFSCSQQGESADFLYCTEQTHGRFEKEKERQIRFGFRRN